MTMYNPPHQPRNGIAVVEGSGALPESWLAMQYNSDLWQTRKTTDPSHVQRVEFEAA